MKTKRICEQCGNSFEIFPSRLKYGVGKYCSRKCYFKSRITKVKRKCKFCGKEFEVPFYLLKKGKGNFCSKNCFDNSRAKITRICKQCGKKFKVQPSRINYGKGKFCSQSCSSSYTRAHRKGFPQHHTKPELMFEEICTKNNLPFKYTGDGAFWIGKNPAVNPDFVECNGKKIAVEIFSYWHDPIRRFGKVPSNHTYDGRNKILKKYGWQLVVFWQEDLERKDAEQFILIELEKYGIISKDLYSPK